jgi:hypothetical protein
MGKKKIKKKRVVTKKKTSAKKKTKSVRTESEESQAAQRGPAPRDTSRGHIGGPIKITREQKHQSR